MADRISQMPTKTRSKSIVENPMTEDQSPAEEDLIDATDAIETDPDAIEADPEDSEQDEAETDQPARLSGEALLEFYNEKKADGHSHAAIAYKAGYYTRTKAGRERVMMAQFNEAFLAAQGVDTGGRSAGTGRSHAGLTKARVSGGGLLLVSQLATRHVKAAPGSVFSVEYPAEGQILLTLTDEIKPVIARKSKNNEASYESPGTPLLDQAA